jgi:hypothetical protein
LEEERDLSTAYRTTKHAPAPQGQGLNDLYIRFFRMAERRIVEKSGEGIVCFISNYSWLDGLSFTGMRERYLEVFDGITVDCLNGDKYKTGKLTPEGAPDPSVFSTEHNREGIQVGTAIVTLVKKPGSARVPRAGFGVPPKRTSTDTHSQETHAESLQTPREVRGGGTPPPARGTRALPQFAFGIFGERTSASTCLNRSASRRRKFTKRLRRRSQSVCRFCRRRLRRDFSNGRC